MKELDLYAKIEPLIGFYEDYEKLYTIYENIIKDISPKTLLDVGCGNGEFLKKYHNNKNIHTKGIDISHQMVQICKNKGLNVSCKKIENVDEKYEVITAIADVLNYLNNHELKSFLNAINNSLEQDGYFLCDINTYYGFSEVADGVMVTEDEKGFLAIEAEFLDNQLVTDFTFFENQKKYFKKYQWKIKQYFYKIQTIKNYLGLKLKYQKDIYLFSEEEPDKTLLVFQK